MNSRVRFEVQYNMPNSEFSEILELRAVQEEALLHFIKREDVFGSCHMDAANL